MEQRLPLRCAGLSVSLLPSHAGLLYLNTAPEAGNRFPDPVLYPVWPGKHQGAGQGSGSLECRKKTGETKMAKATSLAMLDRKLTIQHMMELVKTADEEGDGQALPPGGRDHNRHGQGLSNYASQPVSPGCCRTFAEGEGCRAGEAVESCRGSKIPRYSMDRRTRRWLPIRQPSPTA